MITAIPCSTMSCPNAVVSLSRPISSTTICERNELNAAVNREKILQIKVWMEMVVAPRQNNYYITVYYVDCYVD